MGRVTIYTDGACEGNPGPGGYGVMILDGSAVKELSGGYRKTTNNRMELMAAIVGLEALRDQCQVDLITDSKYLSDAVNLGWAKKWQANRWKKSGSGKAENIDLWRRLLTLLEYHSVIFKWVKGHAGNKYNERCDRLAVAASRSKDLPVDEGYKNRNTSRQAGFNFMG